MIHEELTEKIIGAAYRVYNEMGFGYEESVYERCMAIELRRAGIRAEFQRGITVRYQGEIVGEFRADIFAEDTVIVELKSIRTLSPLLEAQLVNYLVATQTDIGLLINFGEQRVEVRRRTRIIGMDRRE